MNSRKWKQWQGQRQWWPETQPSWIQVTWEHPISMQQPCCETFIGQTSHKIHVPSSKLSSMLFWAKKERTIANKNETEQQDERYQDIQISAYIKAKAPDSQIQKWLWFGCLKRWIGEWN